MFMRGSMASISGFLDLASTPIRILLGRSDELRTEPSHDRGANPARDVAAEECPVISCVSGDRQACEDRIAAMVKRQESLALEGFAIEEITALCHKNNYRWRLGSGRATGLRFIVEPAKGNETSDEIQRSREKHARD